MSSPADITSAPVLASNNMDHIDEAAVARALEAERAEATLHFKTLLRCHWKAMIWSMVISTAIIMEGYDFGVLFSFFGNELFLIQFGGYTASGVLAFPADWQAAIQNGSNIGVMVGLATTGLCQPRFGYKKTYLGGMILMAASIFIPVFATKVEHLLAAQIICGIPFGMFQSLTTAYAADICPVSLRGYLTTYINGCWGIGLTLAAIVAREALQINSWWTWRMPWALQWIWPVPLFVAVLFAPESPWFLVRTGRLEQAKDAVVRLAAKDYYSEAQIEDRLALLQYTNMLERNEVGGVSYADCFRKSNLRRTIMVCLIWSIQNWCGQPLLGYTTQYLVAAGLSSDQAYDMSIGINVMAIAGWLIAWAIITRTGRRGLYIGGCACMMTTMLIIGILGCLQPTTGVLLGIGSLLMILNLVYSSTIGPLCFTIVGEIPSTRLRTQTIVLGRIFYTLMNTGSVQLFARMLGAGSWNWGAKSGFFFVGTNIICIAYLYLQQPETRGRTYAELDIMFNSGIPARKFHKTDVSTLDHTLDAHGNSNPDPESVKADISHVEAK